MAMAEKQFDSVAKQLGDLAFEDVFIYHTSSDVWTSCVVDNLDMEREQVAEKFDAKRFIVEMNEWDSRAFYVRNIKLAPC